MKTFIVYCIGTIYEVKANSAREAENKVLFAYGDKAYLTEEIH